MHLPPPLGRSTAHTHTHGNSNNGEGDEGEDAGSVADDGADGEEGNAVGRRIRWGVPQHELFTAKLEALMHDKRLVTRGEHNLNQEGYEQLTLWMRSRSDVFPPGSVRPASALSRVQVLKKYVQAHRQMLAIDGGRQLRHPGETWLNYIGRARKDLEVEPWHSMPVGSLRQWQRTARRADNLAPHADCLVRLFTEGEPDGDDATFALNVHSSLAAAAAPDSVGGGAGGGAVGGSGSVLASGEASVDSSRTGAARGGEGTRPSRTSPAATAAVLPSDFAQAQHGDNMAIVAAVTQLRTDMAAQLQELRAELRAQHAESRRLQLLHLQHATGHSLAELEAQLQESAETATGAGGGAAPPAPPAE